MSRGGWNSSGWGDAFKDDPRVQQALKDQRYQERAAELKSKPFSELKSAHAMGVDPGKTSGVALLRPSGSGRPVIACASLSFWEVVEVIETQLHSECVVVIEDPGLNPTTFGKSVPASGDKSLMREKISRNVGGNMKEAELLIERACSRGHEVIPHRPQSGKWNREECRQITGYDGSPNNEHVRDALRALYHQRALLPPELRL